MILELLLMASLSGNTPDDLDDAQPGMTFVFEHIISRKPIDFTKHKTINGHQMACDPQEPVGQTDEGKYMYENLTCHILQDES